MASTVSNHEKAQKPLPSENSLEALIAQLYQIKEKFESNYYNRPKYTHYDKARAFAISLSTVMFEANCILSEPDLSETTLPLSNASKADIYLKKYIRISDKNVKIIRSKVQTLEDELQELLG